MTMIAAGFTGTQRGMKKKQKEWVKFYVLKAHILAHGDCIGADEQIHRAVPGMIRVIYPPIESRKRAFCEGAESVRDPKPYLERNHDIVDYCDFLVAAPGEMTEQLRSGTWATIRYARKKGKRVIICYPDGTVVEEA